ncbi:MAG: glycosyltransferase [Candidatus Woesearchaeota archaeon]
MFDCSIVVVTFNRLKLIKECLDSLINQNTNNKYEIIVINNNSTDGTEEYLNNLKSEFSFINVLKNNNTNVSSGRNIGIRSSKSNLILFIDDDAKASQDWISQYIRLFNNNEVLVAGGPMYGLPEIELPKWLSNKSYSYLGNLNHNIESNFINVFQHHLASCNLAVRKSVFYEIGLFKEELGYSDNRILSVEDADFLYRVQEKYPNGIFYLKDAFVYHYVPKYRLTKNYLFSRAFWVSAGTSYSLKSKFSLLQKVKKIPKQLIYLITAIPFLLLHKIYTNNKNFVDNSVRFYSVVGWFFGTFLMKLSDSSNN